MKKKILYFEQSSGVIVNTTELIILFTDPTKKKSNIQFFQLKNIISKTLKKTFFKKYHFS